jgi:hypothetical protein
MIGEPGRGDEALRMCVLPQFRCGIIWYGHSPQTSPR